MEFAKINRYHVSMLPYLMEKLKNTPEGDSNLLENSLIIYGSPMGDSNIHNHKRVPLVLVGHAGGKLTGRRPHQGAGRHADGERDVHHAADAGRDRSSRASATARERSISTRIR